KYVLNQRVGRLRLPSTVDSGYLRLQINRNQHHFKASGQGSSQRHIYKRDFESLRIPIPCLHEQRAIATALSDADALIESLDRLITKKRAIKQAAMQQLLTGQTRLPGFTGEWETKRLGEIVDLHRKGVIPAMFPDDPFQHFSLPAFDENQAPTVDLGKTVGSNKFRVPDKAVLVSKLNPRIPRVWKPESIGVTTQATPR
ncbi:MAG: restriction endonuclease subunit S, partial [Ectothiorhodospira sp.]